MPGTNIIKRYSNLPTSMFTFSQDKNKIKTAEYLKKNITNEGIQAVITKLIAFRYERREGFGVRGLSKDEENNMLVELEKSLTDCSTEGKPTIDDLMSLLKNRSSVITKNLPGTLKGLLNTLDSKVLSEVGKGYEEFLIKNGVRIEPASVTKEGPVVKDLISKAIDCYAKDFVEVKLFLEEEKAIVTKFANTESASDKTKLVNQANKILNKKITIFEKKQQVIDEEIKANEAKCNEPITTVDEKNDFFETNRPKTEEEKAPFENNIKKLKGEKEGLSSAKEKIEAELVVLTKNPQKFFGANESTEEVEENYLLPTLKGLDLDFVNNLYSSKIKERSATCKLANSSSLESGKQYNGKPVPWDIFAQALKSHPQVKKFLKNTKKENKLFFDDLLIDTKELLVVLRRDKDSYKDAIYIQGDTGGYTLDHPKEYTDKFLNIASTINLATIKHTYEKLADQETGKYKFYSSKDESKFIITDARPDNLVGKNKDGNSDLPALIEKYSKANPGKTFKDFLKSKAPEEHNRYNTELNDFKLSLNKYYEQSFIDYLIKGLDAQITEELAKKNGKSSGLLNFLC